jgi:histidinol-phosphate/aromatic aminotransferase/cobyric acid decarboxylase-like protein
MLRDEWKFTYTAAELATAAAAQRNFRAERVAVWTQKFESVMADIRSKGLEVETSQAQHLSASTAKYIGTNSMRGTRIKVDSGLQRDLDECEEKIAEHTRLRNEYAAWVQVLEGRQMSLELDHQDWIYFFGK